MISDIIFDFFGTLVQYKAGSFHTAPYQQTHSYLIEQGFAMGYQEFEAAYAAVMDTLEADARVTNREYHMDDTGRRFFQSAFGVDVSPEILQPFITHFLEEWSRGIVHYDAIGPFLERLATDYRLSIISNTHYPGLIHQNLAAMQIAHHFKHIFTSIEFGTRKPDPAIFHHALEQLHIGPPNALYVGDTYVDDYQGAAAANIACVLIDPGQRYPGVPRRIPTLFDLIPHLGQEQRAREAGIEP